MHMKMRIPRITNAANEESGLRISYIRDSRHSSGIRRFGLYFFTLFSVLFPVVSFAQSLTLTQPKNLTEFVNNFQKILNGDLAHGTIGITQFIFGFCFFGMLTGVLKYVGAGGDEERVGKARQLISYGLLGMVIASTFWGLASLIAKSYLGV